MNDFHISSLMKTATELSETKKETISPVISYITISPVTSYLSSAHSHNTARLVFVCREPHFVPNAIINELKIKLFSKTVKT